jgi:hypothetical protein
MSVVLRYKNHISISIIILAAVLVAYMLVIDASVRTQKERNLEHTAPNTTNTNDSKHTKNITNTTITTMQGRG